MTPNEALDFIEGRPGASFSYSTLKANFKKICHDFGDEIVLNTSSKALNFCKLIIFKIEPESLKLTQTKRQRIWKMTFTYDTPASNEHKSALQQNARCTGSPIVKTAIVCTLGPAYPRITDDSITLSVKHASLLAMETFSRFSTLLINSVPSKIFLTPMAKALYSSDDITQMAALAGAKASEILNIVNESSQIGGHYLPNSSASCALAKVAIFYVPNRNRKESILQTTAKEYHAEKKDFALIDFAMFTAFATGGLPSVNVTNIILNTFSRAFKVDTKPLRAGIIVEICKSSKVNTKTDQVTKASGHCGEMNSSESNKNSFTLTNEILATWAKQFGTNSEGKIRTNNEAGPSSRSQ